MLQIHMGAHVFLCANPMYMCTLGILGIFWKEPIYALLVQIIQEWNILKFTRGCDSNDKQFYLKSEIEYGSALAGLANWSV